MSGESIFGWIKAILTLLLLALMMFLIYKLWTCVSSPMQCLKNLFGGGTGLFGKLGDSTRPGQVKTTSDTPGPGAGNNATARGLTISDAMKSDARAPGGGFWTEENPFSAPLEILITGGETLSRD